MAASGDFILSILFFFSFVVIVVVVVGTPQWDRALDEGGKIVIQQKPKRSNPNRTRRGSNDESARSVGWQPAGVGSRPVSRLARVGRHSAG
jgi:hypothetical protein